MESSEKKELEISVLRKSAEAGDAEAQLVLGKRCKSGSGVAQSHEQAAHWYCKAAEQGHAKAQCCLALCYSKGEGVEKSDEQAIYWFGKAAEQGNEDAQKCLAEYGA